MRLIHVAVLLASASVSLGDITPVLLWHGMGDSCYNTLSMGSIQKLIEETVPGIYVKMVCIGSNLVEDTEHGFFSNANNQVDQVCKELAADPKMQNGYNAIGFSQGGQFLRAVAQRCPSPKMRNFVSVGGQHQGVFGFPRCPASNFICGGVRRLLDLGAYVGLVQNALVQAQYWHDPLNENEYKEKSIFIAEINNEKVQNDTYKTNLQKVENILFIKFAKDGLVIPKESEWFGFYRPGQAQEVLAMNETALYTEDRLGLKAMKEQGKLHFLEVDGDHLQIGRDQFISEIINKYLKN